MKRAIYCSLAVVQLFVFVLGCSKETPNEPETALDPIDQEFGGFTTSQEPVDDYIIAEYDMDTDDELTTDSEVNALIDSTVLDVYYVRITWGMLEWDSTATTVVDWSGSASINKGTLAVMRTIRFEGPTDNLTRPRQSKTQVDWLSNTLSHFDGISLAIIDNDTTDTPGEFTIAMGPYSNTFSFEELDSLNMVESVDDMGNQVSILSKSRGVVPFAGGFLEGRWIRTNDKGGRLHGRWIHSTGSHAGYLKGIWGTNRFDSHVFYGKYMSHSGDFKGLLRGTWGYDDEAIGDGWFDGRWVNKRLTEIGVLRGHFKTGEKKGFFRGRWKNN